MREGTRIMRRHYQDFGVWQPLMNAARNLEPVHIRHGYINYNYVWLQPDRFVDGVRAVRGLAANAPTPLLLQQRAQVASHQIVVVRDQNSKRVFVGSHRVALNPSYGPGAIARQNRKNTSLFPRRSLVKSFLGFFLGVPNDTRIAAISIKRPRYQVNYVLLDELSDRTLKEIACAGGIPCQRARFTNGHLISNGSDIIY
jgi:hypothetical protein